MSMDLDTQNFGEPREYGAPTNLREQIMEALRPLGDYYEGVDVAADAVMDELEGGIEVMSEERFTLREAHERIEVICEEVAELLHIASLDVRDVGYPEDSEALVQILGPERYDKSRGSHERTGALFALAKCFVERAIYNGPIGFTYEVENGGKK